MFSNFSSVLIYMHRKVQIVTGSQARNKGGLRSSVEMSICSLGLPELTRKKKKPNSSILQVWISRKLVGLFIFYVVNCGAWGSGQNDQFIFFQQCYWRAYAVGDVEKMALVKLAKWVKGRKCYWFSLGCSRLVGPARSRITHPYTWLWKYGRMCECWSGNLSILTLENATCLQSGTSFPFR